MLFRSLGSARGLYRLVQGRHILGASWVRQQHLHQHQHEKGGPGDHGPGWGFGAGLGAGLAVMAGLGLGVLQAEEEKGLGVLGRRLEGLPEYTLEQVAVNSSTENNGRVWVVYREGVYDITAFIPLHPGATKLLMAAGGSVEPFWAMYAVHLNNPQVAGLLEQYRIGNLNTSDAAAQAADLAASDSPFASDPKRHPALVINSATPFNAETPLSIIGDSFVTPADLFYVRNHLPVPTVDPDTYTLEVVGLGVGKELTLSLEDLKTRFPRHTVMAAIQCGGNRRKEMKDRKMLKGLNDRELEFQETIASASMALASLMICWIMPITPPAAAFLLYAANPGGGGGPAGCVVCTKAAAAFFS